MKILLLLVAIASAKMIVRLNIFSGSDDPIWTVDAPSDALVQELLRSKAPEYRPWPHYQLGYRGFEVAFENKVYVVYGNALLESHLLETSPAYLRTDDILSHIADHVSSRPLTAPVLSPEERQNVLADPCALPVVGPDNETVYSPQTDNCGYFQSHMSRNNCYNYGCDIVTDTFAQPGRGTGHRWDSNTCESVRAAAERDGLVWAGTELPVRDLEVGHYVSLHIWKNTNFHWLRKDTNLERHWSHKPGGTPVKEVDTNNKKITDPSKADLSPWSIFCGYMTVIPSKVKID